MFGAHLSIAGGMHNALLKAEELGCATVQVFTKNQKQWKCSPLGEVEVCDWKGHCKRLKFKQTVSHDSYLINLAATNDEFWRKSVELFVEATRNVSESTKSPITASAVSTFSSPPAEEPTRRKTSSALVGEISSSGARRAASSAEPSCSSASRSSTS